MEFRYQVIVSVTNLRKSSAKFMIHVQITLLKKIRIISLLREWMSATWLSFMKSNCEAVTFPSVSWVSSESSIYLSFYRKIVYVFIATILSKSFFWDQSLSCICSMCHHCEDIVSNKFNQKLR